MKVDGHSFNAIAAEFVRSLSDALEQHDDEDVAKILALADSETDPKSRWIPWLVALTGARIGEIGQLWNKHVMVRDGIHFIRITETDDGGRVKTGGSERDVAIHPAIIECVAFLSL